MSQKKKSASVIYTPLNQTQKAVGEVWKDTKLLILLGSAGTGKTACAVGLSLLDLINEKISRVILCRPTVSIDEELGFVPGTLDEKLAVWMGAFSCVLSDMSNEKLNEIPGVEFMAIGHCRGITVKSAVLIVDEAQNLTYKQLKAICTRIGRNGKVILCGDISQSDIFAKPLPLELACQKLVGIEGVSIFTFNASTDQLRDEFITKISKALD